MTKEGLREPNYWGSLTQSATVRLGNFKGEEVFTPLKSLLPMVAPEDIVLGGWDISSANLAESMQRAQVRSRCSLAKRVVWQQQLRGASISCSASTLQLPACCCCCC